MINRHQKQSKESNDSNTLDQGFYSELLHIIGLTETKEKNKKLIKRKSESQRDTGSLIESTILQLHSLDKINRMENPQQFGETYDEQLFNIALELAITWINRILFLKLLESQLITYHKGDQNYTFLNLDKIKNFGDLNRLFFQILAVKQSERQRDIQQVFAHVPYLNSSLFEPTELEDKTIVISNLTEEKLPIFPPTVLQDDQGNKRTGLLNTLPYLFEFLDAYDFSSEGSGGIQKEQKNLINASVLGLIFEKINGYKDGSFFTPGFITMYMCRETLRRAVVEKFNQVKGWHCQKLDDLYDKIEDKKEANNIINSLKICDPAVGSGHFLVSALNEIIAIKSELKILIDRQGKTLRDYHLEVINDELIVTDDDAQLFEYNPRNKESQRIQETLFHEKQTIIENCLFGVDINPNSVKICRLRLWIELLKNAYYKSDSQYTELETLPNIDINIKCGNSLISRFSLDANLKPALSKSKIDIDTYQNAVQTYRHAENKQEKCEIEELINSIKGNLRITLQGMDPKKTKLRELEGEVYNVENQILLFEETTTEKKAREKKIVKLNNEIDKLRVEIDDIESGKIYDNAFEWRFEFPEVLDDNGDFIGFDVVIGNPPYIRQEEFSAIKHILKEHFTIYNSIADLLTYFVEIGYNILRNKGIFQFIISNKFTRANYGKQMRYFLLEKTQLTHFIDFSGLPIFDDATVDAAIIGFAKSIDHNHRFLYANFQKNQFKINRFSEYLEQIKIDFPQNSLTENTWNFANTQVLQIKHKVESQGICLKDWDILICRGILTGYNDAFIIDGNKRQELIEKDPNSSRIIKPLLRGRDLQKYYPNYQDLWLINLHNGYQKGVERIPPLKVEDYPAIKEHLDVYFTELQVRQDQGITPYNLRNCAYLEEFEKPKIIYPNMTKFFPFVFDFDRFYANQKCYILTGKSLEYLTAFFNSKLFKFCFKDNFSELLGGTRELNKVFFEQIAVKQITEKQEKPFIQLVNQIITAKKSNPNADTTMLEQQIDQLVYEIYGLTAEEINIIEPENG